ncbi:MAG: GNAT family N-acetyltransferase [Chloroflexi bacterium]|nr:GNAT family N-acetyltransferase [Chloroflexota bacterium]
MHHLLPRDIPPAAGLLARAFFSDPLFGHFFPDPAARLNQLEALFAFRLRNALEDAYAPSPALEGLALWELPREHASRLNPVALPRALSLALKAGWQPLQRMIRFQRWSLALRDTLIRDPYVYLDTLAVAPAFQRQGFARQLLMPVLKMADDLGVPVYLETQNRRNLDIYTHFGFTVLHHTRLPEGAVEHYCLLKR